MIITNRLIEQPHYLILISFLNLLRSDKSFMVSSLYEEIITDRVKGINYIANKTTSETRPIQLISARIMKVTNPGTRNNKALFHFLRQSFMFSMLSLSRAASIIFCLFLPM